MKRPRVVCVNCRNWNGTTFCDVLHPTDAVALQTFLCFWCVSMHLLSSSDRNVIVPVAFHSCATAVLLTPPKYPSIRFPFIFSVAEAFQRKRLFPTGGSERYELHCWFKLKTFMQFPSLLSSFYSQNFTIHCMQVFARKLVARSKISADILSAWKRWRGDE